MPRPRCLARLRLAGGLRPFQHAWLLDRELPEPTADDTWWRICEAGACVEALAHYPRSAVALWRANRDALLAEWLRGNPGRRPRTWWDADAPRLPLGAPHGRGGHGEQLAEPRRRLGGVGTPAHEVSACYPDYVRGIPARWVTRREVELQSGRAHEVHGRPSLPGSADRPFRGVAIDPADPPTYESQASYLERHGLLLPGERRRLTPADFAPEVVEADEGGGAPDGDGGLPRAA